MRPRPAVWISRAVGGSVRGDADVQVGPDVVVDARRATPGALFVALPGDRADGHDYTGQAADAGAAAVLVSRPSDTAATEIETPDGVAALSALARAIITEAHADGLQVLAVTGSSGKTSTKDILAQLLESHAPTIAPVGSFNNEIGVPLTACRVDDSTRYLVSEMGARGPGHIAWLCSLVAPDLGMVLNVGTAHLGEFGSVEAIAAAKGEIIDDLPADGWAVLNRDDPRVAAMAPRTRARLAWFSVDPDATLDPATDASGLLVQARNLGADDVGRYHFDLAVHTADGVTVRPVQLALIGRHQVANAVAAAAAAIAVAVPVDVVAATLNALEHRSPWRMELRERSDGAVVINDSYNANPDSMRAALASVAEIGAARRRAHPGARVLAVLGDMLELGDDAPALHQQVGTLAAAAGVDHVYAVGGHADDIVTGARAGGAAATTCTAEQAFSLDLAPKDVVLVKASRGLALERVAAALLAEPDAEDAEDTALTHRSDEAPETAQEAR